MLPPKFYVCCSVLCALFLYGIPAGRTQPCAVCPDPVSAVHPAPCPVAGEPSLAPGDCALAISRYLARAANVENLAEFNTHSPCWEDIGATNCTPPYTHCYSHYCPEQYAAVIRGLVAMNVQLLARAASFRYREREIENLHPTGYYHAAGRMVCDVNRAYDCAGLPRPILQAGIFEAVPAPDQMDQIHIPPAVIEEFRAAIVAAGQEERYFVRTGDNASAARTDRLFSLANMAVRHDDGRYDWDITRLEAQMWFFYQASTFIDLGYTSIHMGVYEAYAARDRAPRYAQLFALTQRIRAYAARAGSCVPFVLLAGENGMDARSPRVGDTDQLIFDYDVRAMRPHELYGARTGEDGGCNDVDSSWIRAWNELTACRPARLPAFIDPCIIRLFGGTGGGRSPGGCRYDDVPYTVYFDHGSGILPGLPPGRSPLTYGYDDASWFPTLPEACRQQWWHYFYRAIRDDRRYPPNGFLQIPAVLPSGFLTDSGVRAPGGLYVITDDTLASPVTRQPFVGSIAAALLPRRPDVRIEVAECAVPGPPCAAGKTAYRHRLALEVANADAGSIYTWDIRRPDGSAFKVAPGAVRAELELTQPGTYTIRFRQDNLGLPATEHGRYEVVRTITVGLPCCQY